MRFDLSGHTDPLLLLLLKSIFDEPAIPITIPAINSESIKSMQRNFFTDYHPIPS
jgi:hypothetical protein